MADNYTQFSLVINELSEKEESWWRKLLALQVEDGKDNLDTVKAIAEMIDVPSYRLDDESWPSFDFQIDKTERSIWLYGDEGGSDPYKVALAIRAFLQEFRPNTVITFSVAYTCSKLRPDEFNGEEYVVCKDGIYSNTFITGMIFRFLEEGKDQNIILDDDVEVIVRRIRHKKRRR